MKHVLSLFFVLLIVDTTALDNGLGKTPQMGWNSWNHFQCNITEGLIKNTVDRLISSGLADKGYKYVNLDDCWQKSRDPDTQEIIEDLTNFPSGIQSLVNYVHDRGLLFGLYSDAGTNTCQGRPGSLGFEQKDANTYARWGVDYLKYDNCNNQHIDPKIRYPPMKEALNNSGRHIFFSMCEWGQEDPQKWAPQLANSWRTTGDISNKWSSMINIVDKSRGLAKYAGPGAWNDPDMLEVGNGGMSTYQYQTHFVLWAAMKAPLLIGCNLEIMSEDTLEILGNEQVIAINQDPEGKPADFIEESYFNKTQAWGGQLSGNRYILILLNRSNENNVVIKFNLKTYFKGKNVSRIREIIDHQEVKVPENQQLESKMLKIHQSSAFVLYF